MFRVTYLCGSFSERVVSILLESLCTINELYLERHPSTPALADARIRHRPSRHAWKDIPTLLEQGGGSAGSTEDLVCWRVAELRRQGVAAAPQFVCVPATSLLPARICHVMVRMPDGSIEEPARYLGGLRRPVQNPEHTERVTITSGMFRRRAEHDESGRALLVLLEALCSINGLYLAAQPFAWSLYESGVRYRAEPMGAENWLDIPTTLQRRVGDCEDLACWRVAELRRSGVSAAPHFTWRFLPSGVVLYHIVVRLADGRIEDPSRHLGMKRSRRNEAQGSWAESSSSLFSG